MAFDASRCAQPRLATSARRAASAAATQPASVRAMANRRNERLLFWLHRETASAARHTVPIRYMCRADRADSEWRSGAARLMA